MLRKVAAGDGRVESQVDLCPARETGALTDYLEVQKGETCTLQDDWSMSRTEDSRLFDFGTVFEIEQGELRCREGLYVCGRHGSAGEIELSARL
jgi:hypothetical protein